MESTAMQPLRITRSLPASPASSKFNCALALLPAGPFLFQHCGGDDLDRRREPLTIGRRRLDFPDDIHAANDLAERRESLAVWIAVTAEIEFGLIADADE